MSSDIARDLLLMILVIAFLLLGALGYGTGTGVEWSNLIPGPAGT